MDFRGDGVGIVVVTAGSTVKSSIFDSMGSILISYPLASPKNYETFKSYTVKQKYETSLNTISSK